MAATPSLKITKSMNFKGSTRRWSNRYHFNGGTPADFAHWQTLANAVIAAEKLIFAPAITIVEWTGYAAGSDVPVADNGVSVAGTYAGAGNATPGEASALARWSTPARSVKNHPIYLFNYWHGVLSSSSPLDRDLVAGPQKTAMTTYGNAWITGFSDGSITAVRAGPNGVTAGGIFVEEYITHRDFPYTRSA